MEQTNTKDNIYSFIYYWQQGDDLADHLEDSDNNLTTALHNWGQQLAMSSHMIHNLAIKINNYLDDNPEEEISVNAYCHHIEFDGPEEFMEELVEENLLYREESSDDKCSRTIGNN